MNERIKELKQQAKDHADHLDKIGVDTSMEDIFNQKFAELIVRECAELAKNKACIIMQKAEEYAADKEEMINATSAAFQLEILEQEIRKHFGVLIPSCSGIPVWLIEQEIPEAEIYLSRWSIESCKAYAEQLRSKTRANSAEHAAEAIEYLLSKRWVGLTTEEALSCMHKSWQATWNAIELMLKEKNT